jgi:hypothetical protein
MNAPLTTTQQDAVHALQCRARATGLTCELHFDLKWRVIILLDGREFGSVDDATAHLARTEATR